MANKSPTAHSGNEDLGRLFSNLHKLSCKKLAVLREICALKPSAAFVCGLSQRQIDALLQLSVDEIMSLIDVEDINRTLFNLSLTESKLDHFVSAVKNHDEKELAFSIA